MRVPLVIGHRGASADRPENTLEAFAEARRQGADMVELDVRTTADGRLAVHHDARLPDGREVAAVDFASLPRSVPDLAAALEACAPMGVNVEVKAADPAAVVEVIGGERSRVLVSAFDLSLVAAVRALEPQVATAWLTLPAIDAASAIEAVRAGGHVAWHPYDSAVTAEVIAAGHDAGLRVNTWTVDDPDRMTQLAGWGIDGIVTNVPAVAVRALRGVAG